MDTTDRSFEPMDIDLSSSSLNHSNISSKQDQYRDEISDKSSEPQMCNDVQKIPFLLCPPAKRLHINLKPNIKKTRLPNILLCFLMVCTSIIVCYFIKFQCSGELNAQNVHRVLKTNVYGQEAAIHNIIKALDSKEPRKVFVLYGSTGVGKTYAINLMLADLWNCSNVYHYTMPSFKVVYEHSLMTGLILCPSSIVVVDGLSVYDLNIKSYINDLINKSKKLEKKIDIFLIYNCMFNNFENRCNKLFITQLQDSLTDIDASKFFITFNTLGKQDVESCIKKELKILNIVHNKRSIDNLLNNFNVTLDGCKNVYSKIKMLT